MDAISHAEYILEDNDRSETDAPSVVSPAVRGREVLQHERHPNCICLIWTNRPLTESIGDAFADETGDAFADETEDAFAGIHWMPFTTPCAIW